MVRKTKMRRFKSADTKIVFNKNDCNKRMRLFVGIFFLQLFTILFVIGMVGHFVDIPFVPTMIVLRIPALFIFTVIYLYILLLCLNQQRVVPYLKD
jgi:hypothetical protein